MAVPTVSWSETTPAGTDSISAGDDRIRELKTQVREVIDVDHDFASSGNPDTNGQHKQMTLQEAADIGTGASGVPILGAQTIDSRPELVYTTEDDDDIQLTEDALVGGTTQGAIFANVTATSVSVKSLTNSLCGFVPIGGVVAWMKNLTGCPALPANFVECNGQLLSDSESIFDDVTIPNLNGNNNFLRGGATSGGTGGAETVTLTSTELPAHTHTVGAQSGYSDGTAVVSMRNSYTTTTQFPTSSAGSGAAFSILPKYYSTVWIMRIK